MTDTITNLIRIPGMQARVVVDADYHWRDIGSLLAGGFDFEQAEMLDALSAGLRGMGSDGFMQLQYVADHIGVHSDAGSGTYDKEAIIWFLRELLIRLEVEHE